MRGLRKFVFESIPVLILTSMLLLTGCSIESPKAPTWDADLTVPLISKYYDMYELIDRMAEDALNYDSLGNLSISFDQHIDTVMIDAGLSADNVSESFNHQMGSIEITPPAGLALELALDDYITLSAGEIEDVGFDAAKDFNEISEFQSAEFDDADMILTITNYFGLALDSLTIYIVDAQSLDTIAPYILSGGLGIGETVIDTISIDGKNTSNQLGLDSRIHTPGGTLLSTADKYLEVQMQVNDGATVSHAVAKVSEQEKNYSSSVTFNEEHRLTSASISSGQLNISISNNSELDADLTISIPGIRQSGSSLALQGTVSADGNYQISCNLSGYTLVPDLDGGDMALDISLRADLPGSGDDVVTVSSSDEFTLQASLSGLEFSQASGIIAPTEISIDAIHESVDLPKGFEDVNLTDAIITMEIYSEVDIPTSVNIELDGDGGQHLTVEAELNGGSPGNPGHTTIIVNDLGNLTNPIPSEVVVSGIAIAGDGQESGTIYADSKVWGTVEISSPLKFAIGSTEIEGDINSTNIDQDDMDEVSERLLSGTIYATITNHLPFACEVELYFAGDTASLYSDPQLVIGPFSVGAGTVNAAGLVDNATVSEIVVNLSETDLDIIENATLYIGQKIILPGTNGQVVNIINSDYLDIQAYILLTTLLGGEWD